MTIVSLDESLMVRTFQPRARRSILNKMLLTDRGYPWPNTHLKSTETGAHDPFITICQWLGPYRNIIKMFDLTIFCDVSWFSSGKKWMYWWNLIIENHFFLYSPEIIFSCPQADIKVKKTFASPRDSQIFFSSQQSFWSSMGNLKVSKHPSAPLNNTSSSSPISSTSRW